MRAVHLRAVATIIIMSATVHQGAPNTFYGQWPDETAAVSGLRIAVHCP
jgi:hypothetical protein